MIMVRYIFSFKKYTKKFIWLKLLSNLGVNKSKYLYFKLKFKNLKKKRATSKK